MNVNIRHGQHYGATTYIAQCVTDDGQVLYESGTHWNEEDARNYLSAMAHYMQQEESILRALYTERSSSEDRQLDMLAQDYSSRIGVGARNVKVFFARALVERDIRYSQR